MYPFIRRIIKGYVDKDPPPTQQAPLPLAVFHTIKQRYTSELDTASSELIEGALFFGMRSCEYTKTPAQEHKKTTLLELRDIAFFDKASQPIPQTSISLEEDADKVRITFRVQKNQDNCQEIILSRSDDVLCGVSAWCRIVKRLLTYPRTTQNTTVNTYYDIHSNALRVVTNQNIINMLRSATDIVGSTNIGVPLERVGTHSIRTSFALIMSLNKAQDSLIRKIGRWRSDAYLIYIRGYTDGFGENASSFFSNTEKGNFVNLHQYL